jgi:hypothetical protein
MVTTIKEEERGWMCCIDTGNNKYVQSFGWISQEKTFEYYAKTT